METITVNGIEELTSVAEKLNAFSEGIKFFSFEGEMGAGKTTFIKSFCAFLGVQDNVSSPTFSIVNQYLGAKDTVYHFDFYRLKNQQEAYDIGYEDYFYSDALCLVEWPSKIPDLLPEDYIRVTITPLENQIRAFSFDKVSRN